MKKTLFALVVSLFSAWGTADAGSLADLTVVNRVTGQRMPTWYHQGKLYVAGTPGEKYSITLNNKTGARVLTVVSVDGINVISGDTAAPNQSGYVLDSYASLEINGWRKSMAEVAAFVFTALPDSYAARTDRPDNVGVIGVAVFREYQPPRPAAAIQQPYGALRERRADANEAGSGAGARDSTSAPASAEASRAAPKPEEKLGTGHGEREASEVRMTQFRRASDRPNEMISIYYDSYANLVARGVVPSLPRAQPNPFPGGRFVPDPKS
jgi:hypothetical protein